MSATWFPKANPALGASEGNEVDIVEHGLIRTSLPTSLIPLVMPMSDEISIVSDRSRSKRSISSGFSEVFTGFGVTVGVPSR